ncbi:MAG TPA: universal stress protein [Phnomibacter sp.]|nr:universal stress protein [Phnomibacter sp.]
MEKELRLIALIDLPDQTDPMIQMAISFSRQLKAQVLLLHQVPALVPAMADAATRADILHLEKEDALKKLKDLVKKYDEDTNTNILVTEKDILTVLDALDHTNFDNLVLLWLKGTSLFKRFLLGSTATRIVDGTDLPVVAMPIQKQRSLPDVLVVAVSYKYPLNRSAFDILLHHMSTTLKRLEFITVVEEDDDEHTACRYVKDLSSSYTNHRSVSHIFKGEDPIGHILQYMEQNDHPFLVIQQGSRSVMESLFRKFMVNELVYHGQTPLIIIPK